MRLRRPINGCVAFLAATFTAAFCLIAAAANPHTGQLPVPPRAEVPMPGQKKFPILCTAESPCPCFDCRNKRSGYSQCVARYAIPGRNNRETGYFVGGGAALHGEPRCQDEGTWGWDYKGWICRAIELQWWHGTHYQGGTGSYRTDGPRLLHPHP
jgi:hypothetical protein